MQSLIIGAGYNLATTVGPIIKESESSLQRALTTLDDGEEWLLKPSQLDEAVLLAGVVLAGVGSSSRVLAGT